MRLSETRKKKGLKQRVVAPEVRSPKNQFSFEGRVTASQYGIIQLSVKPVGSNEVRLQMNNRFHKLELRVGDYIVVSGKFRGIKGMLVATEITRVRPRAAVMLTNTAEVLEALG